VNLPDRTGLSSGLGAPSRADTCSNLAWSPDSKSLAFSGRISPQGPHGITLISVDDFNTRRLTSPLPGSILGDWNPAVSPDGRTVAFVRWTGGSLGDIYLIPFLGGDTKRLTFDNGFWIQGLVWTPDSRQLVFSSGRTRLWRLSVSGGAPERLAGIQASVLAPAISRQGHRLAFMQEYLDSDIWRYEVVQSTGELKPPTKLIHSTRIEAGPQFSPQGNKIAIESEQSGNSQIWVCDSNGSNPIQLTSLSGGTPRWSPDGLHIAFDSRQEGNGDSFVIGAEGGKPRRLTIETYDEVRPSWSRDGRWIYFGSNQSGDWQVWKMPAGGGKGIQLTKVERDLMLVENFR